MRGGLGFSGFGVLRFITKSKGWGLRRFLGSFEGA